MQRLFGQTVDVTGGPLISSILKYSIPVVIGSLIQVLFNAADIAVRAGLHCAPLAHRTAGTLDTGTVRCSFSAFNTAAQVEEFARLLGQTLR